MSARPGEADLVPIELGWLSQRLKLRDVAEDWTGMTNQIQRRKLQNRLNQRAHRTRARGESSSFLNKKGSQKRPRQISVPDEESSTASSLNNSPVGSTTTKLACLGAVPRVQELMRRFADHACANYMQGTPALSHLNLLVRYNVSSALVRNADMLGVTAEYFKWEGISPFVKHGFTPDPAIPQRVVDWPANMHPTPIQCSIEHHPWLDVFPWPRVRDNMLQAFEHLGVDGEDELCHDIIEHENLENDPMLVVWGDAWDPHSWEITLEFLKKWGWLFSGCEEALEATNYWRAKRGENLISRKQLYEAIRTSVPIQFQHAVL